MTRDETIRISVWAFGVLAVAILLTAWLNTASPSTRALGQFSDTSAALAFVSGAALTIERITEVFWTVLGGMIGTFWPLRAVARQVTTMANDLDQALTPFQDPLKADLDKLAAAQNWTAERLSAAHKEVEALQARFDEMKQYPPSNQRFQLLVAAAAQNVKYLEGKYGQALPHLTQAKAVADLAMTGLQDFLATFKDNPGRRLISLYLGCLMGLLAAGLYHLNAFAAALGGRTGPAVMPHDTLSVIFTGLLMGLGANPTHEVIRAIQEYKKSQKGGNALTPS